MDIKLSLNGMVRVHWTSRNQGQNEQCAASRGIVDFEMHHIASVLS
jgi:hypothetical protein